MNYYELIYLISPDISEEELKGFSERIKNFIQEEGGNVEKTTKPAKEKLSYPLKKKKEAFSVTLIFHLGPEKLGNLEKKLRAEKQILRYLILKKEAKEKILRPKRQPKTDFPWTKTDLELTTKKATKPKKVELENIDKEIEEILKE